MATKSATLACSSPTVASSNPAHGDLYSIQQMSYSLSVTCHRSVVFYGDSGGLVSSTNKTDHHDIIELLLKVALNTLTLTISPLYYLLV